MILLINKILKKIKTLILSSKFFILIIVIRLMKCLLMCCRGADGYDLPKDTMNEITRFQRKQKKGTIDVWWLYDDGGND